MVLKPTKEIETMLLDISAQERAFLSELLEDKQNSMLHELNHTDTAEFKAMLKQRLKLLEALKSRIDRLDSSQPGSSTN
jgi:DNA mismatch repair ATPase MutS